MVPVIPKKRPGRPATGRDPLVAFRLPAEVIDRLDQMARDRGVSRSHFFRTLLDKGEEALRRKQQRLKKAQARIVAAVLAEPPEPPEPEPAPVNHHRRGYRRQMTADEVKAAADRAQRRAK
jgi:hypothetical protein